MDVLLTKYKGMFRNALFISLVKYRLKIIQCDFFNVHFHWNITFVSTETDIEEQHACKVRKNTFLK
jgi:hypothetical protein